MATEMRLCYLRSLQCKLRRHRLRTSGLDGRGQRVKKICCFHEVADTLPSNMGGVWRRVLQQRSDVPLLPISLFGFASSLPHRTTEISLTVCHALPYQNARSQRR